MRRLAIIMLVALAVASPVAASGPLRVAEVGAPAINCFFDPSCTIAPTDTVVTFSYPTAFFQTSTTCVGILGPEPARLQTRTYVGAPGSSAAGLHVYEYRIDLGTVRAIPVAGMGIDFGPVVALDFDGDLGLDDVFLTVQGAIGTAVPTIAFQFKTGVFFEWFDPNLAPSGFFFDDDSSVFIGLISVLPPGPATAFLQLGQIPQLADCPMTLQVPARAPDRNPLVAIRQALSILDAIPLQDWHAPNDRARRAHRGALMHQLEHSAALLEAGQSDAALALLIHVGRKLDGRSPDWVMADPASPIDPVRLLYLNVATAANLLSPGSLPMSRSGPRVTDR